MVKTQQIINFIYVGIFHNTGTPISRSNTLPFVFHDDWMKHSPTPTLHARSIASKIVLTEADDNAITSVTPKTGELYKVRSGHRYFQKEMKASRIFPKECETEFISVID